ncbi:MAG TPA: TolC family protein [Polyangiaceae bacterium]|nr:TolC family protein [Polyangiaceae bacterium]
MKVSKRFGIFCQVLGVAVPLARAAWATQPLDAFLTRAEAQSFDSREASATERQRDAEADAALGRLTPTLTARGIYTRNQYEVSAPLPDLPEPLVITPQDQLDAVIQLDVPLIDLGNYYRYRSARELARGASAQRDATTIDVSRSVARAYYLYVGAWALVRSARESIDAADANRSYVEARRGAGAATDLDLERASANVERARQDLADAELGVALSARSLETLSGLRPEPSETSPAEDDLHSEGALESWLELAGRSPATRVAGHQKAAAEQNRKAARMSLLPTLSGAAQERVSNATGFNGRSSNYSLQVVLSWRLDYGLMATDGAQQAALEAQSVRRERTERAVVDAAFEAYQRVDNGIAKSRAARAQARAAARAAALAQERYTVGAATQLDVTQAQRDAFLASASQIQADFDLAYARAALRLAAGVPISTERAPSAAEMKQ